MRIFLLVFHIIIALFLIGVVLLQPGEDAAGSSKTMTGQANLLTKMTGILGGIFFMTSLFMAILIRKEASLMTPSAPIKKELRVSQEPESEKDQTKTKIKTQPVSAEADEKPIASVKEMAEPKASVQSHGESTSAESKTPSSKKSEPKISEPQIKEERVQNTLKQEQDFKPISKNITQDSQKSRSKKSVKNEYEEDDGEDIKPSSKKITRDLKKTTSNKRDSTPPASSLKKEK